MFQPKTAVWPSKGDKLPQAGSDAARNDMLVDGAIGGAIGLGLGALTELAITAANVSLFVASPLLAPLVLLGWGATLGGTVGAMVGAEKQGAPLFELIRDAVSNGQVVLVVETRSEREASMTRSTMHKAVGDFRHLTVSDAQ